MREGLAALLSRQADIEVVAELDSDEKILPTALELRPDVALIDIRLPDGFAAARALHEQLPGCGTLIMADRRVPQELRRAVDAQVLGFMLKDVPAETLADAVRRVARRERVVDSELAFAALDSERGPLTPRELEILHAVAQGLASEEIAARLFLSVRTVRNHISRIVAKTGARNRMDAVRVATKAGWL